MTFRHIQYEPPHRFGEEMISGPFQRFVHVHEFESVVEGTRIIDHLDLVLPLWSGGALMTRAIVAPIVRHKFAYRHAVLQRIFGGPS